MGAGREGFTAVAGQEVCTPMVSTDPHEDAGVTRVRVGYLEEAKLDHEKRLRFLERLCWMTLGASALSAIGSWAGFLSGVGK